MLNSVGAISGGQHVSLIDLLATGIANVVELGDELHISISDCKRAHWALTSCITKVGSLDGTTIFEISTLVEIVIPFSVIQITKGGILCSSIDYENLEGGSESNVLTGGEGILTQS